MAYLEINTTPNPVLCTRVWKQKKITNHDHVSRLSDPQQNEPYEVFPFVTKIAIMVITENFEQTIANGGLVNSMSTKNRS